ncbi:hypothetical protein NDU88_002982 [Pleurodeles waltl]|uniref:Uncharacterized protein n=1 Tax=Pleurodeles waltl TaxID=8319 RepID=A0AAV7WMR1_PLEWA|nr:hypothetical protein NDU88_002982 [Pleurodeles waltl]
MGRQRRTEASQGNTMEQYTTAVALPQQLARSEVSGDVADMPLSAGELSRAVLLAANQGSRVALEGKIDTVAVEVNLLRADLRKVSDKEKAAEGSIMELQSEVGILRMQMAQATSTVGRLEVVSLSGSSYASIMAHRNKVVKALKVLFEDGMEDLLQAGVLEQA